MKGDFSRNTFDPAKHFSRVLIQQGRVQLDADWNEQAAITLHYLRSLNVDLVGQHWGPAEGLKIVTKDVPAAQVFTIASGHYYVNGVLCENPSTTSPLAYTQQASFPFPDSEPKSNDKLANGRYLVYLDVWERHIVWIDDASIREVALGGPDTATRAQVVWQVKLLLAPNANDIAAAETLVQDKLRVRKTPTLRARARRDTAPTDLCAIPPESRYRGAENQLYRVEIHNVIRADNGSVSSATFKWSRDNGSVLFPVLSTPQIANEITVTLAHLGRDDISSLTEGDMVELVDDRYALRGANEPLCRVKKIDPMEFIVTLECADILKISPKQKHIALRRWDHKGDFKNNDGALKVVEATALPKTDVWQTIEDGIEIQFCEGSEYRSGDYWLIPARTTTGDVEWPVERDLTDDKPTLDATGNVKPLPMEPAGVMHYFAPLALIEVAASGTTVMLDCRREIIPLALAPK